MHTPPTSPRPEAGVLLGRPAPTTVGEMRMAAFDLLALGAKAVLLKGGRLPEGTEGEGMARAAG